MSLILLGYLAMFVAGCVSHYLWRSLVPVTKHDFSNDPDLGMW